MLRQARVVFLHELLTLLVAEHRSVASHGLGDKEARTVAGVIEGGGMELDEFHVLDRAFGTIDHRNAVARRYERIGCGLVDRSHAACGYEGDARQECVDFAGLRVEHIGSVAGDVGSAACDNLAEMVLGDNLDREMMFEDIDILVGSDGFDKRLLDFKAGVVGMVEYAELGVASLTVKVE